MPAAAAVSAALMLAKLGVNTAQRVRQYRDAQDATERSLAEARQQAADLARLFGMRSMVRAEEAASVVSAQQAMMAAQGVSGGATRTGLATQAFRDMAVEFEGDAIQTRQRMREISDEMRKTRAFLDEARESAIFGTLNEAFDVAADGKDAGVKIGERVHQNRLIRNPDLLKPEV